eukprot:894202-Prymnesium_polylepis.1
MEAWASSFHAACWHVACTSCLKSYIDEQLFECALNRTLRIECFMAGCKKTIPQRLVPTVSPSATKLASTCMLDADSPFLATVNDVFAPEIEGVGPSAAPDYSAFLYPHVAGYGTRAICCTVPVATVKVCSSSHRACMTCVGAWADVNLPSLIARKEYSIPCLFAPACTDGFPAVEVVAATTSETAARVVEKLERRAVLQSNQLFPATSQVDCRNPTCLGLGYLGFDTVMCLICEDQWVPEAEATPEYKGIFDPNGHPTRVKRCP